MRPSFKFRACCHVHRRGDLLRAGWRAHRVDHARGTCPSTRATCAAALRAELCSQLLSTRGHSHESCQSSLHACHGLRAALLPTPPRAHARARPVHRHARPGPRPAAPSARRHDVGALDRWPRRGSSAGGAARRMPGRRVLTRLCALWASRRGHGTAVGWGAVYETWVAADTTGRRSAADSHERARHVPMLTTTATSRLLHDGRARVPGSPLQNTVSVRVCRTVGSGQSKSLNSLNSLQM